MLNKKKINLFLIWFFLLLKIQSIIYVKEIFSIFEYFLNFILTLYYSYYFLRHPENYNEINTSNVLNIITLISFIPFYISLINMKIFCINMICAYYYFDSLLHSFKKNSIILPLNEKKYNEECSICLLIEKEQITLPCNHHYHKTCILEWLNIQNNCPLCRQPYQSVVNI
jgi:hypothetical protein